MTLENGKKVVALDFDGVLHFYTGWNDGVLRGPIAGMNRLVDLLMVKHGCHVVVFTTREKEVVQVWLEKHGFPELDVINHKWSRIDVFVDDRACYFNPARIATREDQNNFAGYLANFQPYWREEKNAATDPQPQ